MDWFRLTVNNIPPLKSTTKRALTSDVAKTYDVLGWFAPSVIYVKVLLQRLWEARIGWDDPVPLTSNRLGKGGEPNSLPCPRSSLPAVTSQRM